MTPTAVRATEAQCQATIIDAATRAGWLVHAERPAQSGKGRWMTNIQGHPGWPDLALVKGSRFGPHPKSSFDLPQIVAHQLARHQAIKSPPDDMDAWLPTVRRAILRDRADEIARALRLCQGDVNAAVKSMLPRPPAEVTVDATHSAVTFGRSIAQHEHGRDDPFYLDGFLDQVAHQPDEWQTAAMEAYIAEHHRLEPLASVHHLRGVS